MYYWRLSGFYFFYFASLGALIPYWGLYLKSLNFSVVEIGELVAILMATKIIAPNVWAWIADHSGRRMRIVQIACLLATLSFTGVFLVHGYWALALVITLFSFFWNAALPQFEATTLNHLGDEAHRYSTVRLWGSIGFVVAVAVLGRVFETTGAGLLPTVLIVLFAGIWLASLLVPEHAAVRSESDSQPLRAVLKRPEVLALLLVCFLVQASHGPYYTFYSLYLMEHGYSKTLIGQLWALGVVAEIIIFLKMHHWLPRFGVRRLLLAATLLTALRWGMVALFVDQLSLLIVAQTLHAASFGLFHAVAIHLTHQLFTGRHQGRGQALYSSVSFGAGGAVGSLLAGYLWEGAGARWMYVAAALAALLASWVVWRNIEVRD
ncbi:MAG TPA: MFS transporter [Gammaproteobacteria bacterium]|nr:MFS transporter [Gammaproteobacteria bacterium]